MSYSVKKIKDLNFKNIFYENPKKVNTFYQSLIQYQMNGRMKPLMVQTPHCINLTDFSEDKKYLTIELEITNDLYDFFINLDEQNAEKAFINSSEWFKQDIPKDIIDDYYKSSVKPFKENVNPKLKVKIPYFNGECQTKIYDNQRNIINLKDIPKGSNILLILHINSIRFLKQNFYTDIYVTQIKVCYKKDDFTIPNVCIVEDDFLDNILNVDDLIDSENILQNEETKEENDEKETDKKENDEKETDKKETDKKETDKKEINKKEIDKETDKETKETETDKETEETETETETDKETEETEIKEETETDKETEEENIIQMEEIEEVKSREENNLLEKKKEKLKKKIEQAKKEFQYACNIFEQAEELITIKNNNIKILEEKLKLI